MQVLCVNNWDIQKMVIFSSDAAVFKNYVIHIHIRPSYSLPLLGLYYSYQLNCWCKFIIHFMLSYFVMCNVIEFGIAVNCRAP